MIANAFDRLIDFNNFSEIFVTSKIFISKLMHREKERVSERDGEREEEEKMDSV